MVTDRAKHKSATTRARWGNALIALGVLAWLPYIVLRMAGEDPPLLGYLLLHLLGVTIGSRLRRSARNLMGVAPARKSWLATIGHGLIFLGVLVWVPYLYRKLVVGEPVAVMTHLPYHLVGVLTGSVLLAINRFNSQRGASPER